MRLQSCVVSVSVAECPVELDRNSCADDEERKEEEEGRVTPLVQDFDNKQDIECGKEPVVEAWKENEREERKEEDIDKSRESQESERERWTSQSPFNCSRQRSLNMDYSDRLMNHA